MGTTAVLARSDREAAVGVGRRGALSWALWCLVAASLGAQGAKPKPQPKPSDMLWRFDTPQGFRLPEPGYRFPTPIKEALVQFVQPVPELTQAYADVCQDKRKFALWLKRVLLERKKGLAAGSGSGPTVLSSDPSRMSAGKGTITTTRTNQHRTRVASELEDIETYLTALKLWAPE